METGAITAHIDVAQVTLYVFWLFFAGLVFYLRREDRREGYPLLEDGASKRTATLLPWLPSPKTFLLRDGTKVLAPRPEVQDFNGRATPIGNWPGAPLQPDGDPMIDGVGPAAYAMRSTKPDTTIHGEDRIVPLRVAFTHYLSDQSPDPRGMVVMGFDGVQAGIVRDLWVDRAEEVIRYIEVTVTATGAHVLLPMTLSRIDDKARQVKVASVKAMHFATAPATAHPDSVSMREEDRIAAYFGSGHLYADPSRSDPLL